MLTRTSIGLAFLLSALSALSGSAAGQGTPDWQAKLTFPEDDIWHQAGLTTPGWVKFTFLLSDPSTIYFQNSQKYEFHYDFAREHLPGFIGATRAEFDSATLHATGQTAVLGAVLSPPITSLGVGGISREYAIQFVRLDALTVQETVDWFQAVQASITSEEGVTAYYLPTSNQRASADAQRDLLEASGVTVAPADLWVRDNVVYSQGWGLGTLKYVPGSQIETEFLAGRLTREDILLTDSVPAEVPFLAGILSLSPATPNAHTAILAKNFGIPFAYLADEGDRTRANELLGRRVVLRAEEAYFGRNVRLIEVEGVLTEEQIAELLSLKEPPVLDVQPIQTSGTYTVSTEGLSPGDIATVGGKAANYGILRRAIPENSRLAMAITFDLWQEFLAQQLSTGRSLREEIDLRLSGFGYPPVDMPSLAAELDAIQGMFRDALVTEFSPQAEGAILAALQDARYGFDTGRKLRFRSSTNMEDAGVFTGAGLYDSYSGCLADELDGDVLGPSLCDPDDLTERGVFRAIRRVFASFYNLNAYLERRRHDIPESDVGMAILVHHSFPDPTELANGVAVFQRYSFGTGSIELVSQKGAVSVTNPEGGSIPEIANIYVGSSGSFPDIQQYSNLVLLGETVLDWTADYEQMGELMRNVATEFADSTGLTQFVLEAEFKKIAPGGDLIIKQVREVPRISQTELAPSFLVNEPIMLCTFQGESGDIFSNHRLKSRLTIETRNVWLKEGQLSAGFFTFADWEYVVDGVIRSKTGVIADWNGYSFSVDTLTTTDSWLVSPSSNPRTMLLIAQDGLRERPEIQRVVTLEDLDQSGIWLQAEYERPVQAIEYGEPFEGSTTTRDYTRLAPCPEAAEDDLPQERIFTEDGVTITTQFYWPNPRLAFDAGYTAPLVRWEETTIEGFTAEPIILTGWYSQTYRPGHHNFFEHFLFEPRLEDGISPELLAELKAQDVRLIYAGPGPVGTGGNTIVTFGFDEGEDLVGATWLAY